MGDDDGRPPGHRRRRCAPRGWQRRAAQQGALASAGGLEGGVHGPLVLPAVVAAERRVAHVHEDVAVRGDVPLAQEARVQEVVLPMIAGAGAPLATVTVVPLPDEEESGRHLHVPRAPLLLLLLLPHLFLFTRLAFGLDFLLVVSLLATGS